MVEVEVFESLQDSVGGIRDGAHGHTWSEAYRMECEARFILGMPLEKRRSWLAELERVRGNIDALKQEIVKQWKHGKPQADKLRAEIKRQKRETP